MAQLSEKISFEITIKEIRTTTFDTTSDILIEERHYTDKELQDNHHWMQNSDRLEYMKKLYGTKPTIGEKKTETEVFSQTVSATDGFVLRNVIGAINDLKS